MKVQRPHYAEAFPADRKAVRNRRLLERQLALLHELGRTAARDAAAD